MQNKNTWHFTFITQILFYVKIKLNFIPFNKLSFTQKSVLAIK